MPTLNTISSIIGLLFGSRPFAVSGRVMAVVIYAVYTMVCGWFFTHIFNKVFKRITPSITHSYAAATPVIEPGIIWVIASFFHTSPGAVFGCSRHIMSSSYFAYSLFLQTTTRLSMIIFKIICFYNGCVTAITDTIASRFPFCFIRCSRYNNKTIVSFSNKVDIIDGFHEYPPVRYFSPDYGCGKPFWIVGVQSLNLSRNSIIL